MRFLIDECLSPALVGVAHDAGYEAHHVAHRAWSGFKDGQLFAIVVAEHFALVTNNRDDFIALIRGAELHPGLVVIVGNVPRAQEMAFFRAALAYIRDTATDMVNVVVEVDATGVPRSYALPPLE